MDKLQLTGQNLGRVFNFRYGHLHAEHFWCYQVKLPNLKLKTRHKQLLGSLLLVIKLLASAICSLLELSRHGLSPLCFTLHSREKFQYQYRLISSFCFVNFLSVSNCRDYQCRMTLNKT